jgi:hypothetical protein
MVAGWTQLLTHLNLNALNSTCYFHGKIIGWLVTYSILAKAILIGWQYPTILLPMNMFFSIQHMIDHGIVQLYICVSSTP